MTVTINPVAATAYVILLVMSCLFIYELLRRQIQPQQPPVMTPATVTFWIDGMYFVHETYFLTEEDGIIHTHIFVDDAIDQMDAIYSGTHLESDNELTPVATRYNERAFERFLERHYPACPATDELLGILDSDHPDDFEFQVSDDDFDEDLELNFEYFEEEDLKF